MLKKGTIVTVCLAATLWVPEAAADEDRIGPFEIDTPNDSGTLGIGFASQLRGQLDGIAVEGEDHEIEPSAQFARMRLLLRGSLLHDRSLKMGLQVNMLPGSLELLDVWSQYRFHEQAKVRAGIFKTPYTVHREQSFSTLVLADWGLATRHFGAERQLGLMVHNFGGSRFRYAFGVFTGENTRAAFANRHTIYYGDTIRNPSDLTQTPELEEPHPEIIGQVGWGSEDIDLGSNTDAKKEGFRYHLSASAAYDIRPTVARDMDLRVAGELLMKWQGVSLNGVFYAGFAELSEQGPLEGFAPLMFGPQAELAYRPIDEFEIAARYSWVQLTQEFRDDARGRADTFIDEASEDDLAVVSTQYADAGLTAQLHEVTGGVNVYFIGHSLKWQTDGSFLPRQFADVWFNDWRVRTQLQVAF